MKSAMQGDEGILDRLRRREPAALGEVVTAHARPLHRAARAMGFDEDAAEDLVQSVFQTFLERLDEFEGRSVVRTWLFGILHHKMMERRRERVMESIDEEFAGRFDGTGHWSRPPADLERLLLSKEIGEAIRDCAAGLGEAQREAFVLREVEGLETEEICKILGVSVTHFGVLLFRARARLRECLEKKGWRRG